MPSQNCLAPLQVTSIKTANYAVRSGELVQCDASGGSFTIALPGSPRVNQIVGVKLLETTGGNSVTIARNGNAIEGEAGDATLAAASEYLELQYNGAGIWIDRTEQKTGGNAAVATITANTTLTLDQEVVLCNNSSNITVTLPTASGNSGKSYTLKKIGNNTATVTLDAAGSETIDGTTTVVLFVQYDSVSITSDGSNWSVIEDGRQQQAVKVYRSTAQTIPAATFTKILLSTAEFDVGSLFDVSNNQLVVRRASNYGAVCGLRLGGFADGNAMDIRISKNGANVICANAFAAAGGVQLQQVASGSFSASPGDTITFLVWHNQASSTNTFTSVNDRPFLFLWELK